MRKLPTYKAYTIDVRLHELRHVEYGKATEFIPFASPKGQGLLKQINHGRESIINQEVISMANADDWTCLCGNQPHRDGFYPCDRDGREVEPTTMLGPSL